MSNVFETIVNERLDAEVVGTYCQHAADVALLYTEDFDGYPVAVVLVSGLPCAYVTSPESSYGNAEAPGTEWGGPEGLAGHQMVIAEGDPAQQFCLGLLLEFAGEAGEGFAQLVAEKGSIYKAWDAEAEGGEWPPSCGDGRAWCAFVDQIQARLAERAA